ncbi:hypothetical protein AAMO2058_001163100 [Amorphochlora amoebiformis]
MEYSAFVENRPRPTERRASLALVAIGFLAMIFAGISFFSREDQALGAVMARPTMVTAPLYSMGGMRSADVSVDANRGKAKTRSSAKKRYKITSSGKVFSKMAGKQHLNTKMSRKQKSQLGRKRQIGPADIPNVQGCLPHIKVK